MKFNKIKQAAESALAKYKADSPTAYAAAQQAIGSLLILDGFIGIDNPFGGKKRPGIFGALGGVILGIVFIFMPVIFNMFAHLDKLTENTTATVVSVNHSTSKDSDGNTTDSCSAVVSYEVDGKQYQQNSSFSSSDLCGFTAGSDMDISYNPDRPGDWGYNVGTLKLVASIFMWAGVAVVIVSLFTFAIRLVSIIFGWKILKSGRALAKTLPAGTDLGTLIAEVKRDFSGLLFGGANPVAAMAAAPAPTPAPTPSSDTSTDQTKPTN